MIQTFCKSALIELLKQRKHLKDGIQNGMGSQEPSMNMVNILNHTAESYQKFLLVMLPMKSSILLINLHKMS